jgi:precorrin-2/cobalt-factor-2 C20-methyltransferase
MADNIKPGTLIGIGVGPGDPDLMTVKAIKAMNAVDVIFAAGHQRSGVSIAAEIARPHLLPGKEVVQLNFPHTFDSVDGREPHREAAGIIAETLKKPASAAFLTLGDPMTFSTFTYVRDAVLELLPSAKIEVVPGITSFAAAAAATGTPLAEGEETLAIMGAARETEGLLEVIDRADNIVIMKPYKMTERVCEILEERGLADSTHFCTECSRPTQKISRGLAGARNAGPEKYMSLFLVRKKKG